MEDTTRDTPRRRWVLPLVAGLAVVAALVVGGVGGYGLARATGPAWPVGIHQGPAPQGHGPERPDDRRGPHPGPRQTPPDAGVDGP